MCQNLEFTGGLGTTQILLYKLIIFVLLLFVVYSHGFHFSMFSICSLCVVGVIMHVLCWMDNPGGEGGLWKIPKSKF